MHGPRCEKLCNVPSWSKDGKEITCTLQAGWFSVQSDRRICISGHLRTEDVGWEVVTVKRRSHLKNRSEATGANTELLRGQLRLRLLSVTPRGCQECKVEGGGDSGIAMNEGQQLGRFYLTGDHNLTTETHTGVSVSRPHAGLEAQTKGTKYQ